MKRTYIKPSIDVFRIQSTQLLAGSAPEYGGVFGSREMSFSYDEEDE